MRNSSVLLGLVLGIVLAALLSLPLGLELPARYVSPWPYVPPGASLGGMLGSLALPLAAGFAAARFNPDEATRAGAGAGIVSALISGVFVVLPAVGVWAHGGMWTMVSEHRAGGEAFREEIAGALLANGWMSALAASGLLLGGVLLGMIGGVLSDMTSADTYRSRSRIVHRSSVPMAGALVVLVTTVGCAILGAHLEVTVLPRLGLPLGWLDRTLLTAYLLPAGIADILILAWTLRDSCLLWRSGRRLGGALWATLALSLVASTHIALAAVHPMALLGPIPLLSLFAEGITALVTLFVHRNSDVELAEGPRGLFELAIEGLEMGVVSVSLFAFTGGSAIVAALLQGLPFAYAAIAETAYPAEDPSALVRAVFLWNLGAIVPMVTFAFCYAVVATPVWLLGIAFMSRAEERTR